MYCPGGEPWADLALMATVAPPGFKAIARFLLGEVSGGDI
jgi:hypothetical protein